MDGETHISRQISVYKTDRKLAELIDKLNPAPVESYAHLHAQSDEVDGRRTYSNIGVVLQDYSAGTGDSMKKATANLSPDELMFIFSRAQNGVSEFEFRTEKIFGEPDSNGMSSVTKLIIKRASVGSDGKARRYPWYIEIENGKGVQQKTQLGGIFCKAGSFVSESKVFINMSDIDFYKLFCRAARFITAWENSVCIPVIRKAREMLK